MTTKPDKPFALESERKRQLIQPRPILRNDDIAVPLPAIRSPEVMARPVAVRENRRKIVDARRLETAKEAISGFSKDVELFGMTKGQFSLLDLIKATLEHTGPACLHISTWTAALAEIGELAVMQKRGSVLSCRWLADISLGGRDRGVMQAILQHFGRDSVRVTKNHSKFCLFVNDDWKLVLLSSMNLNMNPRMENYQMANDPALCAWLLDFMGSIWGKQSFDINDAAKHRKEWQNGSI